MSRHRRRFSAAARAAFAALAAATAPFLLGLELPPPACFFRLQVRCGLILKGFVVLHQVEADAVDPVGGVDGGFDFGLTAVEGVEEGDGDGRVVEGGAVAHLVERVAESGIAVF